MSSKSTGKGKKDDKDDKKKKTKKDDKKGKDDKKKTKKDDKKEEKNDKKTSPRPATSAAPPKSTSSITKDSDPSMPSSSELAELFETLLNNLGIGTAQKEAMRHMTPKDKWVLIQQNKMTLHSKNESQAPESLVSLLKGDKSKITVKKLEDLRVLLAGQPVEWVEKFLKLGGLQLLFDLMQEKQVNFRGHEDTEIINECARALKALMNSQPGLEAVIMSENSIPALGQTLDYVTGRMKTVIVEVLSALCLLSPEAHTQTVEIMKAKPKNSKEPNRFAALMAGLDLDNVDLKVTVMQLINALLSAGEEEDQKVIKDTFNIEKVVETLRKGQMKATLEVQLDIYDQMALDDQALAPPPDSGVGLSSASEQEALFANLLSQVKGTPAEAALNAILQHIMLVRKEGKAGALAWDLIDKFVQITASAPEYTTDVELGQALCKDLLSMLQGSLKIDEIAAADKPPEVKEVLEDNRLGTDEKLQLMVKKFVSVNDEQQALKAKLAEAERRANEADRKSVV